MRFNGRITSWDDARGFGFIQADQGGEDVFVHIKAMVNRGGERPCSGQRVSFEVTRGPNGKKRAASVLLDTVSNRRTRPVRPVRRGGFGAASLLAVPAFALLYVAVTALWQVPGWTGVAYLVLSGLSVLMYAVDKAAAMRGGWRTTETTMLAVGLLGGWPGALVAQQWLRHKSVKASFRTRFWMTVLVNVIAFLLLSHPAVRSAVRSVAASAG